MKLIAITENATPEFEADLMALIEKHKLLLGAFGTLCDDPRVDHRMYASSKKEINEHDLSIFFIADNFVPTAESGIIN